MKAEPELAAEYDVSRTTIRSAINELAEQNFLVRRQGKGTFVCNRKLERDITKVMSHTEICALSGMVPGARTISAGMTLANQLDAELLNVKPGEKLVSILRLRYADGITVILEDLAFSWDYRFMLNEDIESSSLYEVLRNKYHIVPVQSQKQIEFTFANETQSRLLCVPENYPLLLIIGYAADANGNRVHRTYQYILGDRFKMIV